MVLLRGGRHEQPKEPTAAESSSASTSALSIHDLLSGLEGDEHWSATIRSRIRRGPTTATDHPVCTLVKSGVRAK